MWIKNQAYPHGAAHAEVAMKLKKDWAMRRAKLIRVSFDDYDWDMDGIELSIACALRKVKRQGYLAGWADGKIDSSVLRKRRS